LVPPGNGTELLIGYQPWPDRIRRVLVLREQTLMRKAPPAELLFEARENAEAEKWVWEEAGEALDLRGRDLRYADFYNSRLGDADLRDAQLQGAGLREAVVYGTKLQGAELSLADLRELRLPRDDWEELSRFMSRITDTMGIEYYCRV